MCVAACTVRPGQYIEPNDRVCVTECPTYNSIISHRYEANHSCVYMVGTVSGCPGTSLFADPLTMACTARCPAGYFADTHTKFCVETCTNGEFADPYDRTCKTYCTSSPNSFAYSGAEDVCVQYCPPDLYAENVTWTCTDSCPNMTNTSVLYAYKDTWQCVINCPIPYYAYLIDQACVPECPPDYFAYDLTRECLTDCPGLFFADDSTHRCVETCPDDPEYYGYQNVCVPFCTAVGWFRDNSTRLCVQ